MFGERVIGDTPATNPKTLMGRNIEVGISDLTGRPGKDFYRITICVDRIDEKSAYTRFNGYRALKDHVMRIVRKRSQKIDSIMYLETRDKWKLQVSSMAILNRNTEISVKKSVRVHMEKALAEFAGNCSIDDFVKGIIEVRLQKGIKRSGTKIYPVRFFEVTKIEVKGMPSANEERAASSSA